MAQVAQSSGYSNNLNNRIDWEIRNGLDSVKLRGVTHRGMQSI